MEKLGKGEVIFFLLFTETWAIQGHKKKEKNKRSPLATAPKRNSVNRMINKSNVKEYGGGRGIK